MVAVELNKGSWVSCAPENELVNILEYGGHAECPACPLALACSSGAMNKLLMVGSTREDHRDGVSVKCVERGQVKLVTPRFKPVDSSQEPRYVICDNSK